jgi:hypothetical protein
MSEPLITIEAVDARLEHARQRRAEARPVKTPQAKAVVEQCNAAIDRLLALRFTLMEDPT